MIATQKYSHLRPSHLPKLTGKEKLIVKDVKPILRSLPIAKQCQHNTGENGREKAGCTTCVTYGCSIKGTVRLKDCVYCEDHENPAEDAVFSWSDLPIGGDWIKRVDVWEHFRKMIADERKRIKQTEQPSGNGNGIVIVGGGKYFPAVYCNVRLLRHMGCKLPVEVWYLGRNNEMPGKWQSILKPYGVVCVDADKVRERVPMRILNGWELKFYAIQHSSFRRVLFLDADCYPMREPSFVFDDPRFLGAGAVFQRDTPNDKYEWIKPDVLEMVGLPRESVWDLESGACLIDKQRWGKALAMTVWLNSYSDLMYQVVYGDKTTPALASRIMGQPYAIPRNAPGGGSWGLMQYWFDGLEMWQHRIHCKPVIQQAHFHSGQNDSRPYKWSSEFDGWLTELKGL
ncbi:MAG TPA: hypothetical protein PLN21_09490, partial [Gemmatales bacterium]|nr:hypothetical protein [Gemmatales bacterium]